MKTYCSEPVEEDKPGAKQNRRSLLGGLEQDEDRPSRVHTAIFRRRELPVLVSSTQVWTMQPQQARLADELDEQALHDE